MPKEMVRTQNSIPKNQLKLHVISIVSKVVY